MAALYLLWALVLLAGVALFVVAAIRRPRRLGWGAAAVGGAVGSRAIATAAFGLHHRGLSPLVGLLFIVGAGGIAVFGLSALRILTAKNINRTPT